MSVSNGVDYSGTFLGIKLLTDSSAHFTSWLVKLGKGQVKQVISLITNTAISGCTFTLLES